jgi:Cu2+-containing amine oxidase
MVFNSARPPEVSRLKRGCFNAASQQLPDAEASQNTSLERVDVRRAGMTVCALQVDGVLASIIFDDFFEVGEAFLKADPQVQALCKEFGIESMDEIAIDPWPSKSRHLNPLANDHSI